MVFHLEFLTEEKDLQELCETYWLTDARGKFVYKISEMESFLDLKQNELVGLVQKNCHVFHREMVCKQCGKPTRYFRSRSEWLENRSYGKRMAFMGNCVKCQQRIDEETELQNELEDETFRNEKHEEMRSAFNKRDHKKLTILEHNFLTALSSHDTIKRAAQKIGLSEKSAQPLISRLNDLHLINFNVGTDGWYLLPELESELKSAKFKCQVKSIFGSPKARELFGKLKKKYPFVYPEIPLSAFIDLPQINHLLNMDDMNVKNWRVRYFFRARIDFVVCDADGKPLIAYEYQGSYHNDDLEIREKDEFKRMVLAEVGLPLKEVTHHDLIHFDEFGGNNSVES